jgi:hypothetical protein
MYSKLQELVLHRKFDSAKQLLDQHKMEEHQWYFYSGIIDFLELNYPDALTKLSRAKELGDDSKRTEELISKIEENTYSQLSEFVPGIGFFEKEKLVELEPILAEHYQGHIPQKRKLSPWQFFLNRIGNGSGYLLSATMTVITEFWGKLFGYTGKIWTNWYRRSAFTGVLTLAYMRNKMNRENLFSTYPSNKKVGFIDPPEEIPPFVKFYRTANGSWNNLDDPKEGAVGTRFQRNIPIDQIKTPSKDEILFPNPRKLSRVFLTREGEMKKAPFINMLAAAWIQFQNHDWISHGETLQRDYFEIPLEEDDPARLKYQQDKLFIGKTQPDPTKHPEDKAALTFINEVTHWWDGSQLYGSYEEDTLRLRSFNDGKLIIKEDGTLPIAKDGVEDTGFKRNWWVGLSLFHTLFVHEHNAICTHLKSHYPAWEDNQLFHTARLVNSALMAKIHSIEWNSAINPNGVIFQGNHSNWYGFLTTLLRSKKNWKTVADINVRNTEMGGVVGNPIDKNHSAFGLTQEFVEAYRIHSMLPEELRIKRMGEDQIENVPFSMTRQAGSPKTISKYGLENLFYSMGNQNPGQVVLNNYPRFMQELSIPGNPIYDLGAVDLLRARERAVPRYNEFRRLLGLKPILHYADITDDQTVIEKFKLLYGEEEEGIEKIDFMIGTLAEKHRPKDFAFGETMFQLFLLNSTRRLQADRFYTDCYTEKYYTAEGMKWIDSNTLKSVLLRNFPGLASTGLANITNAFEPWDEEEKLDPSRHPTRAFDVETKKEPWVGENFKHKSH